MACWQARSEWVSFATPSSAESRALPRIMVMRGSESVCMTVMIGAACLICAPLFLGLRDPSGWRNVASTTSRRSGSGWSLTCVRTTHGSVLCSGRASFLATWRRVPPCGKAEVQRVGRS
jgi:hypothetical protein